MESSFTLITGRTTEQARGLHEEPGSSAHVKATAFVQIGEDDMTRLGIREGQVVRLKSAAGLVEVPVRRANLPSGLLFIPMGPTANILVGAETFGTGMPAFKGLRVALELI